MTGTILLHIKNILRSIWSFLYEFVSIPQKILGVFRKLLYGNPIIIAISYFVASVTVYQYYDSFIVLPFGENMIISFMQVNREMIVISAGTLFVYLLAQVNNTLLGVFVNRLDDIQKKYESTFEQSPVGITQISLDECWIRVNEKLCSMLDYEKDEFLQLSYEDILNPKDIETIRMRNMELLNGEKKLYQQEIQLRKKDGSQLHTLVTKSIVYDSEEQSLFMLGVFEDISKLKESELELRNTLDTFRKFVPNEFLKNLKKEKMWQIKRGDHVERTFTIMFTDIRSYTLISENMTNEENFDFISSYVYLMSPVIKKYNGFIDKFMGDAIMALFPGKADNALKAALAMQKKLSEFNERLLNKGKVPIEIGIGLNTGTIALGTVGDDDRLQTTVLSDQVNVAQRIEELTKVYNTPILLSENTYESIEFKDVHHLKKIDRINLKGRQGYTNVFGLTGGIPDKLPLISEPF